MKKLIAAWLCLFIWGSTVAASEQSLDHVSVDVFDELSVIRGAAYFGDYCLGCHGLKQIRYSRLVKDLKVNEAKLKKTILFGDIKIHESIKSSMTPELGVTVFGVAPPDLSLVVRSRGSDWVFTYLKSFYVDAKRPYGVNNVLLPNVAMPNVLWELQGSQRPLVESVHGEDQVVGVQLIEKGSLSERQFDSALTDIVNFLAYVSEPSKLQRVPLGKYVIGFLLLLTYILYKLKKEYWKDID